MAYLHFYMDSQMVILFLLNLYVEKFRRQSFNRTFVNFDNPIINGFTVVRDFTMPIYKEMVESMHIRWR